MLLLVASAAPAVTASSTTAEPTVQQSAADWDTTLTSNELVWQSQRAYFDGTEIVNNASIVPIDRTDADTRTFEIRTVEDGSLGEQVAEFQVNETGVAVIEMQGYEPGEYVIVYENLPVLVEDGVGTFTSNVSEASFGVATQDLSASFEPSQVGTDASTELVLDSNREEYVVSITATGLQTAQVNALFEESFANSSVENGTLVPVTGGSLTVDVASVPIDPGTYEFQIGVVGSPASSSATLTVGDGPVANETVGAPPAGENETAGLDEGLASDDTDSGMATEMATEEPTPEADGTETTPGDGPGFGLLVAAVALLGLGLLARRR